MGKLKRGMRRGRTGVRRRLPVLVAVLAAALAAPAVAAADTLTLQVPNFPAVEGQSLSNVEVASFVDSVGDDGASDYTASINWGDGTVSSGTVSGSGTGPWKVHGSHTYLEEGTDVVQVTVTDNPGATGPVTASNVELVQDAPLSAPTGPPAQFSATGSGVGGALSTFEGAIGGADNGTTAGEQSGGYRHITWDDIATDGSDPGSTVITPGHVVAIALNRLQARGISLGHPLAVANDGFTSVNSGTAGLFSSFSAPNVFAPFNTNTVAMQVISPTAPTATFAPAQTRGLGIVFLNVEQPDQTTISYYNQSTLIGQVSAPVAGHGQPSFAGLLFPSAVVTKVLVTLGGAAIFSFDGSTASSGPSDSATTNLVAADDVVMAEPTPVNPPLHVVAGQPVSGTIDSFSDLDPNGTLGDYRAQIDWGDGTRTAGTIVARAGGFGIVGSHTYLRQGAYGAEVAIYDFGSPSPRFDNFVINVTPRTSHTSVRCSRKATPVQAVGTCTATVSDTSGAGAITPTGTVSFVSTTLGLEFISGAQCGLKPSHTAGVASCTARFVPTTYPPRSHKVIASYAGDPAHNGSAGSARASDGPPACLVGSLPRRLSHGARTLRLTITCGMRATGTVTVVADAARRGSHPRVRLTLGHAHFVGAVGQHVRVTIKLHRAAMQALRVATAHRQRITLAITVVAVPKAKPVRSTASQRGLRVT